MTSRRVFGTLTALLVAGIIVVLLIGACHRTTPRAASGAPATLAPAPTSVTDPHDDDGYSVWLDADDEDKPDCDAEDWRKQEVPDCGFVYAGKFYPWSWAAKGKKTAPTGWRPGAERRAVVRPLPTRTVSPAAAVKPVPARTTVKPVPARTTVKAAPRPGPQ